MSTSPALLQTEPAPVTSTLLLLLLEWSPGVNRAWPVEVRTVELRTDSQRRGVKETGRSPPHSPKADKSGPADEPKAKSSAFNRRFRKRDELEQPTDQKSSKFKA